LRAGCEPALWSQQSFLVACFHQLIHQSGRRDKGDRHALLAGRQTQPKGDMGFTGR